MENPEDLVTFDVYPDAVTAYIIKGVLNTNGIECVIANENMSSLLPLPDCSASKVRILVFRKDFDAAKEIVARNSETTESDI